MSFLDLFTKNYRDPQIKKRMVGLDTLRACAIILVFMYHYPWKDGVSYFGTLGNIGWSGVDLFFVLSGYLIGNQVLSALSSSQGFSMGRFYYRRAMRTLPDYWFVLALYFIFPGFHEWHQPLTESLWRFLTFTQNFGMATNAFSHSWSLCVEEQFYFVFPFLAIWFFSKSSARLVWSFIVAFLVFEVVLRAVIWEHYFGGYPMTWPQYVQYMTVIYYPTYTRLIALIMGVSIALLKNKHESLWEKLTAHGNKILTVALVGCAISFYFYRNLLEGFHFAETVFAYPLLDLSFALLVLASLSPSSVLYRVQIPFAGKLAAWSYAAYLLQKEIIFMTNSLLARWDIVPDSWVAVLVAIVATLLASYLLYTCIEMPFLKLRERK